MAARRPRSAPRRGSRRPASFTSPRPVPADQGPQRLQKVLAQAGICSRRRAEELIRAGRVRVDGELVTAMGLKVDPRRQQVTVDGRALGERPRRLVLLLHKPRGYVTTLRDPQGRPTVLDLIPDIRQRVFPVGRLDLDSEGALLLTNDGALAQRILHPSNGITRTYVVVVRGRPSAADLARLERGILLDGRRTAPARARLLDHAAPRAGSRVEVVIHEGRKRQVRRMLQAVGHPVVRLIRMSYGGLGLGNLEPGGYRVLGPGEIRKIFS